MTARVVPSEVESLSHVLVVDDSTHVRLLLRMTLAPYGHKVQEAADGVAGWRLLVGRRPDVLIMDVTMPGLSGLDTCRAIRADPGLADLPVIILTANGLPENEAEALEAGADCFFGKPFQPRALADAVARLAGEPSARSARTA